MSEPGVAVGIDYGTKRIGLAASDPARRTAFPVGVIEVSDTVIASIAEAAAERSATLLVVGLPVGLSGSEGESARAARRLGDHLAAETGLPVEYADERFTTRSAEQLLVSSNVKRRKRRTVVDAMAAAVMLQNYLDTRNQ